MSQMQCTRLMEERDELRKADPSDPRIQELNTEIKKTTNEHRKKKWLDHLNNCGPGTKKLWDCIKSINNPPKTLENKSIKFNKKHFDDPNKIANNLNKQYTPGKTTKPSKEFRRLMRKPRKKTSDPDVIITPDQTRKAIKKAKNSKAMGPDDISPIMLNALAPMQKNFLTNLFNNVVSQAIVPPI